ncbi:MAG: hypothetical protein Q7T95_24115 [Hydrogenophaga sp.]|nr:hypothetical protein [Hydrogenophaga sp.]MDO9438526.1 hypothetical protein [Hydrogenophaga sp.]
MLLRYEPQIFDTAPRIRTQNLGNLITLDTVELGQTATQWQKSLYPAQYQPKSHAVHEGIDTGLVDATRNRAKIALAAHQPVGPGLDVFLPGQV